MKPTNLTTEYEDRIIAFIDILGFKALVNAHKDDAEFIRKILEVPRKYFISKKEEYKNKIEITMCSDSIIISFKYDEAGAVYHLLVDILHILIQWMDMNIICRGAIVKGKMIHEGNLLFGPGYVEAAVMEENKVVYPRIVLNDKIFNIGQEYHREHVTKKEEEAYLKCLFTPDVDHYYYIDYITAPIALVNGFEGRTPVEHLSKLKEIIENGLKETDLKVREKYSWMIKRFSPISIVW